MKRFLACTLVMTTLFCSSIGADAATSIVRMSDKSPVAFSQFVTDTAKADAVFIGDTHDDGALHAKQVEIVRALYAANPQLAIAVEMFTTDDQKYLDDWSKGKLEEKEFAAIYARNWSYDWRLYRDLFIFARDNRIPMIALNVPKPLISKVVRQGAKSLTESEQKQLPPGMVWSLNPRQAEYLKRIREQAFANVPPRFPIANFNEAQALRNQVMAHSIVKFREKAPMSKVVAIAGTWHAIKNGVPESLKTFGSATYKVVLQDLAEFAWLKPTTEDADYLISRGD